MYSGHNSNDREVKLVSFCSWQHRQQTMNFYHLTLFFRSLPWLWKAFLPVECSVGEPLMSSCLTLPRLLPLWRQSMKTLHVYCGKKALCQQQCIRSHTHRSHEQLGSVCFCVCMCWLLSCLLRIFRYLHMVIMHKNAPSGWKCITNLHTL